ncbi:hypothetical protein B0H21DRAFT_175553 [Amylocystis lapponica]|nr:hypothetical protein B0H21DRAFT_175553 [Amylocystis lapponica]
MLVLRSPCRILKSPHLSHRKALSDVSRATYPPVARALPFAFSEEQAILRLSIAASFRSFGNGAFRSLCATYFPSLGFKPIRPVQIQALYLPAWIIDAEVQADGWLSGDTDGAQTSSPAKTTVTASLQESYMPGFAFDPLSRFAFSPGQADVPRFVPWSESLLHQHGSDIQCLPFTHSPFALVDAARSLSFQQATVSSKVRFDPPTVTSNFFAAYPILIPVYLMRYEAEFLLPDKYSFAGIVEAYNPQWRRSRSILEEAQYQFFISSFGDSQEENFEQHFARIRHLTARPGFFRDGETELAAWLDAAAARKDALGMYHAAHFGDAGVDWDDMRVRPYTAEERKANRGWLGVRILNATFDDLRMRAAESRTLRRVPTSDPPAERNVEETPGATDEVSRVLREALQTSKFPEPAWFTEWARQNAGEKRTSN